MPPTSEEWGGSLHQTFRLIPDATPSLNVFLEGDGEGQDYILDRLPYDRSRAGEGGTGRPDPKRYRDGRHVFQTAGLLVEQDSGLLHVTELGHATRRWIGLLSPANAPVLGRHAAYALAACQLRNPSGAGRGYSERVEVFPFSFIWRAMLELNNRISSDELNRAIFRVIDEDSLARAIQTIRQARAIEGSQASEHLGPETISGANKNDRIIPWISLASFGWLLIADKRETNSVWYSIRPSCLAIVKEASLIRHQHSGFRTMTDYVRHISECASLPKDIR